MIIYGQAGSGKSEVSLAIRKLLKSNCNIGCMTASAAYKICGKTLHRLIQLPTTKFLTPKELTTKQL